MKQMKLQTISELEHEIKKIRELIESQRYRDYQVLAKPLFRGHANASWELTTTLERYAADRIFTVEDYNNVLCATAIHVTAFTDRAWSLSPQPEIHSNISMTPPNYDFMAYARHHGFPSPLLDWTQSLYIALFFAFQEAHMDQDVSIFVYVETLSGHKSGWVGAPHISLQGPYVATHRRHFLQQGQYTIAVEKTNKTWTYCAHSKALPELNDEKQDVIYKFNLLGSIRFDVLKMLGEMNITAFTLLGDENSLMNTLAFKEIMMHN